MCINRSVSSRGRDAVATESRRADSRESARGEGRGDASCPLGHAHAWWHHSRAPSRGGGGRENVWICPLGHFERWQHVRRLHAERRRRAGESLDLSGISTRWQHSRPSSRGAEAAQGQAWTCPFGHFQAVAAFARVFARSAEAAGGKSLDMSVGTFQCGGIMRARRRRPPRGRRRRARWCRGRPRCRREIGFRRDRRDGRSDGRGAAVTRLRRGPRLRRRVLRGRAGVAPGRRRGWSRRRGPVADATRLASHAETTRRCVGRRGITNTLPLRRFVAVPPEQRRRPGAARVERQRGRPSCAAVSRPRDVSASPRVRRGRPTQWRGGGGRRCARGG